jgi:hypothetical protein
VAAYFYGYLDPVTLPAEFSLGLLDFEVIAIEVIFIGAEIALWLVVIHVIEEDRQKACVAFRAQGQGQVFADLPFDVQTTQ